MFMNIPLAQQFISEVNTREKYVCMFHHKIHSKMCTTALFRTVGNNSNVHL